jgi:hypothetical protein
VVCAASVNPADGQFREGHLHIPLIPGWLRENEEVALEPDQDITDTHSQGIISITEISELAA